MNSRHIGIVGVSAEGAALCYRTICAEGESLLGPHDHPEVSLHTHPLARYMECIDDGDWRGVGCEIEDGGVEIVAKPFPELLVSLVVGEGMPPVVTGVILRRRHSGAFVDGVLMVGVPWSIPRQTG